MSNIYNDGTYLKNNPTWDSEHSSWKAEQIKRIIVRNRIPRSTICEVGCGAGEVLNQLSARLGDGKKYFGYEVSPQAFELCGKLTNSNLTFFLKDLVEEDGAYYDIVMAIDVIEHVDDYIAFLRKLKTRGMYKIFHIPLDLSVQTVLRVSPIFYSRLKAGHIHYFTKETALAALEYAGYEIMDYFYTGSRVDGPTRSWKANIPRIPRRALFSLNHDLAVRILGGYSLLVLTR
jgi:SAM-dependent methyltransferase